MTMNLYASKDSWTKKGYTVGHTVTHYSFHDEMFWVFVLFCFIVFVFIYFGGEGCKGRGYIEGDEWVWGT